LTYLNSDQDPGTPLYYSPVVTRKVPADTDLSAFSAYMQYLDTMTNLAYDFNGIVIVPPASQQMLIEVRGFFYSKELVEETDVNHWTVNHPLTLVKAVMRELEIFNQNQSKVKGWDDALLIEIDQINKDLVSELVAEVESMELKDEEDVR
jgi:hypothetical protein